MGKDKDKISPFNPQSQILLRRRLLNPLPRHPGPLISVLLLCQQEPSGSLKRIHSHQNLLMQQVFQENHPLRKNNHYVL